MKTRKPYTCRSDEEMEEYMKQMKLKIQAKNQIKKAKSLKAKDKSFNESYKLILLWS